MNYINNKIQTGEPGQFRVRGQDDNWWVEGTDRNGVWVDAEPEFRYITKEEAENAKKELQNA